MRESAKDGVSGAGIAGAVRVAARAVRRPWAGFEHTRQDGTGRPGRMVGPQDGLPGRGGLAFGPMAGRRGRGAAPPALPLPP